MPLRQDQGSQLNVDQSEAETGLKPNGTHPNLPRTHSEN